MGIEDIKVRINPKDKTLREFHESKGNVDVLMGPLGSGKTWQVCQTLFTRMCEQAPNHEGKRRSRTIACRNSYKDLFSTTIREWQEKFEAVSTFRAGSLEGPNSQIRFDLVDGTTVEAEILYMSMDGTHDEITRKFRGVQATWLWPNELKELPRSGFDIASSRLGRYPSKKDGGPTHYGVLADTNAPDTDHWLYNVAEVERPQGWRIFKQPGGVIRKGLKPDGRVEWAINPNAENLHNLPPDYYFRNMQGKTDAWISVNLANEYGAVHEGMPVYPQYSDIVHCVPTRYVPEWEVYVGVDFGGDPAAAFTQRSPEGTFRVIDELVTTRMSLMRFGELLGERLRQVYYHSEIILRGDPSGSAAGTETGKNAFKVISEASGFPISAASTNDPTLRTEAVAYSLSRLVDGQPSFAIDPRCTILRKGFLGAYGMRRLAVAGAERYEDRPSKNKYSHIHDALQYAALAAGFGNDVLRGGKTSKTASMYTPSKRFNVHKLWK